MKQLFWGWCKNDPLRWSEVSSRTADRRTSGRFWKAAPAELFAGSGFISYTTTLKADVLSDVDERLLNYHRWLAKNDTTEIVVWLNRRLGDWRGTKEEYDALKAYVFGQEPNPSPEFISAWVFYGSVTFGRSFDKNKGAARNERGGKIESDGIPQTCKDLLCVKPEPKRIICRGYEEALNSSVVSANGSSSPTPPKTGS